jgi:glycosyltransferase involved in cell wall biosynthesis
MNQALPLVSIVTPSYNKGRFIEETILSIRIQTYPRIEHIVIDGGSTDGTLDILRKYEDRLVWVSEPDKGQSDAINKGWRRAKGEVLAYLNADDTYMPRAVQTAVEYLANHPDVAMVYGQCHLINENGEVIGQCGEESDLVQLLRGPNMIPQPTVFFRRGVLDQIGYLDTSLHMAMDYDLWIRIGLGFGFEYIPQPLASFRLCEGTKTVDSEYGFGPDLIHMLDKLFSNRDLPQEIGALRRQAYSYAHFILFLGCRASNRLKKASHHLAKALMLSPHRLQEFGGMPLITAFLIELLVGTKALQRATKWKSRFRSIWHRMHDTQIDQ